MHTEVKHHLRAVKKRFPQYFRFKRVLEVGSLNINGSSRRHFWFCDYTGIDLGKGRGVDIVCPAHEFVAPNFYDVVISCECAEHDEFYVASFLQMYENLKSGGLMIITCASTNRAEHGTFRSEPECSPFTQSYYKNISIEDFKSVLPPQFFSMYSLDVIRDGQDLVFYGIKL